jgi:hypothetical protein
MKRLDDVAFELCDRSRIFFKAGKGEKEIRCVQLERRGAFKVDASVLEAAPYLHPSGNTLYFASNGRGGTRTLEHSNRLERVLP